MRETHEKSLKREKVLSYGRRGTATHWTLQDALTDLAGGADTVLTPSGLSACTIAILGCVKAGDHILVSDSAYEPTRLFCNGFLKDMGVETEYFDSLIGAGVANLLRDNTTLVFCESPGSHTFEVQDIPAISAAARAHGAKVAVDNTWASPAFCRPLALGAHLSVEAATKYIVGHSDVMLGAVTGTDDANAGVHKAASAIGFATSPDDVYLATRGLHTLGVRLRQHQENAWAVAQWLQAQPAVKRVLYPPLPSDPGHALWKRDFTGGSGLMGVLFRETSPKAMAAMIDGMKLFALGFSWGGYESLIAPTNPQRSAKPWTEPVPGVRLHVGLEDVTTSSPTWRQG